MPVTQHLDRDAPHPEVSIRLSRGVPFALSRFDRDQQRPCSRETDPSLVGLGGLIGFMRRLSFGVR